MQTAREILLWCFLINYAILIFWFICSACWDALYVLCAKWLKVSVERVREMNFLALALFKGAVILFNLVPLIALWIAKPA